MLKVYSKRIFRRRRISHPYLSGDAFASLCEITYNPPKLQRHAPNDKDIRKAKSIFVKSDELDHFFEKYEGQLSAKVIISGNSDFEFHEIPKNLPKSIELLLLQNSFISDGERIRTLPIGIENFRWGVNGNPRYISPHSATVAEEKILFGPFGNTHPDRQSVALFLEASRNPEFEYLNEYLEPPSFDYLVSKFKYVAAVRGNGIDTHRLWETLYRNRIPIVQESPWAESLRILGLPISEISTWDQSELFRAMEQSSHKFPFDARQFETLWLPYWEKLIKSY